MPQAQTRTTDWRINEREDIQFLLGNPPSWTMRYGIMVVAIVFSVLLLLSYVIKYPDVVTARVVLTTENPPIRMLAPTQGRVQALLVRENDTVSVGTLLAVLDNTADWKAVLQLEKLLIEKDALTIQPPQQLNLGNLQNLYSIFCQNAKDYQYFLNQNGVPAKIAHLQEQQIKFFFLDYGHFLLQGNLEVTLNNTANEKKLLKISDINLDLDDVSAVLWNPPRHLSPLMDFEMLPTFGKRQAFLFRKRWVQFLKELPQLLSNEVVWIPGNPFNGAQEWQNKLGEYKLAKTIGFNIPAIIFTNDELAVRQFAQTHGNKRLLREFSTPPFSFPPIPLQFDKISLKNLNTSPCSFQQYVDKQYELRVVVLFNKIFPCKIYSQDSPLTKGDWRVHDDAKVKWELLDEFPADIYDKIMALTKALNLNWCSIDMIYGVDNQYYFLEANRPGAHYWLDPFVGLDISAKIVEALLDLDLVESELVMEALV
jgi:Biotin-lipoyl like